jgi:hypothetical protein
LQLIDLFHEDCRFTHHIDIILPNLCHFDFATVSFVAVGDVYFFFEKNHGQLFARPDLDATKGSIASPIHKQKVIYHGCICYVIR